MKNEDDMVLLIFCMMCLFVILLSEFHSCETVKQVVVYFYFALSVSSMTLPFDDNAMGGGVICFVQLAKSKEVSTFFRVSS